MRNVVIAMLLAVVLVSLVTVPASAGPEVTVGLGLVSVKDIVAEPAVSNFMTTSSVKYGSDQAQNQPGLHPYVPVNRSGLFPEFIFLNFSRVVATIKEEQIRNEKVTIVGCFGVKVDDSGGVWIATNDLALGLHHLVRHITHNASRKEWTIAFFWHEAQSVKGEKDSVFSFTLVDEYDWIDEYCVNKYRKHIQDATNDMKKMARKAYIAEQLGSFRFMHPEVSYNLTVSLQAQAKAEADAEAMRSLKAAKPRTTCTFNPHFTKSGRHLLEISGNGESFQVEIGDSRKTVELKPGRYTGTLYVDGVQMPNTMAFDAEEGVDWTYGVWDDNKKEVKK